jgi:hypothetical protein
MQFERREAEAALFLATQTLSLSFAVSVRLRGPLAQGQLEGALAGLGRRHPTLAVRAAARDDGTAYFTDEGVPPVSLLVADRTGDDDWVAAVERAIEQRTPYLQGPFVRCVWLRGPDVSDLILICDHLTGDGRAAVYALSDLLESLADPARIIEALPVPQPLHELVPADVARQIIEDAADLPPAQNRRRTAPANPADSDASAPAMPAAPRSPARIRPFSLTIDETAALVARSRAEGVTVQAAMCAAFLTPFAEADPDRPLRRVEIPVDLRPKLTRATEGEFRNAVGLAQVEVDCTPGRNLWDVARDAARALANIRHRDAFATPAVVMPLTGRWPKAPWDINYDISISNLGRLDLPESFGELTLESIYGPIFPATGPKHLILGISTFGGQLRCTFSSRAADAPPAFDRGRELIRLMLG